MPECYLLVTSIGWQIGLWGARIGLTVLAVIVYIHAARRTIQIKALAEVTAQQTDALAKMVDQVELLRQRVAELEAQTGAIGPSSISSEHTTGG